VAPPTAMQRITIGGAVKAIGAVGVMRAVGAVRVVWVLPLLRLLAAGDEGRKPLHVLFAVRLKVLLRTLLVVLWLVLIVLRLAVVLVLVLVLVLGLGLMLIVLRLLLARIERLRLARGKRLAAYRRLLVAVFVVAVLGNVAAALVALLLIIGRGRVLAELLLRRRDQAEIMLGVLIVILR